MENGALPATATGHGHAEAGVSAGARLRLHLRWVNVVLPGWFAALCLCACQAARTIRDDSSKLSLIPQPALVEHKPGTFPLRDGAALIVDSNNAEVAGIAHRFADLLAQTRGIHVDVRPFGGGNAEDAIVFSLDSRRALVPSGEGYDLAVDAHRIVLIAREPRGLFYGGVTLWQLLTEETTKASRIDVPQIHVVDHPRFAWRGVLLDSARHYQSPAFIKRFIDQLALLKLDTLHWHLTDDQGWRIEIKRYPKLTSIGGWRRPAGAAGTDANGQPVRYGGYYTQEEIRDIVRYAAERYVTIVPEIDMPGHMQAAIAAYPEIGSLDQAPVVSPDWGVHTYLLNVDESTLAFVDNVLDEIVDLFPGPYIHIGGDEAVKDQWKASARVQARMRALSIGDENALQAWFVAELEKHLARRGRRLVGWDEILEGGVPASAIVMSWRGTKGGIDAARAGHDVVMAPSPGLYLDHLQSNAADEPPGRPDVRTLADIYAYEPIASEISAREAEHVLGAEAALWTEHMRTEARLEHAAFPRLDALAEVLWSPRSLRDWHGFVARLVPQMDRHRVLGMHRADSAFDVRVAETRDRAGDATIVTLSDEVRLPIRYTIDGSVPDASARIFEAPLHLSVPSTLRTSAFLGDRQVAPARTLAFAREDVLHRSSGALGQCSGKLTLRLEDDAPAEGPRAIFDVDLFDPCWIWKAAPLDGISGVAVDVGQIPYNFQLAHDIANIVPRPAPSAAHGELMVKLDGCKGATLATIPLAAAIPNPALTMLSASWKPVGGAHDLCFEFATRGIDPLWAIDRVRLVPATP
jgi:hexosaminidase